ncbi:MAG: hypothetical protein IJK98_05625, partial [Clostridia bacterium]|nr:hypothetical protein [Clostridia bacterium]
MKKKIVISALCLLLAVSIIGTAFLLPVSGNNLYGDVDRSGKVTPADARIILRASVALETLTDEQKKVADVDADFKITSSDARIVLRAAVSLEKLPNTFPEQSFAIESPSEIVQDSGAFPVVLKWWASIGITSYGTQVSMNDDFKLSYPIEVFKGDVLHYHGYFEAGYAAIAKSNRLLNTYMGIQSYPMLVKAPGAGVYNITYTVEEDGYIVVFSKTAGFSPSLTITRAITETQKKDSTGQQNYVDELDFVPNLANKRANAILNYTGDTKKSGNYIVNAVAYPNGEIIACRAGGDVVRIANDGTETVLMTIERAQDWRCLYMDSNLNVYVSPHSSTFEPGVAVADRGLYRLAYGEDQFDKVIPLFFSDPEVATWEKNERYAAGTVVFYNGFCYKCAVSHTSGEKFDADNWTDTDQWNKNTSYSKGDIVRYNNCYFVANTSHISGDSLPETKENWYPAAACVYNDDTIWTMCEDDNGWLYAGVYAHEVRRNPAVYRSTDGGLTWFYLFNFATNGTLEQPKHVKYAKHIHCINFNEYDHCLYAAVGEINTIVKSEDHGATWTDLEVSCYYGQPTYVLGVKDGLLIGSDGHYSCGVSKLMPDGKTLKNCGRTAPGFIFNIRRSDLTGWLYAFTRNDNYLKYESTCPPVEAVTDPAALERWKNSYGDTLAGKWWTDYHTWAEK